MNTHTQTTRPRAPGGRQPRRRVRRSPKGGVGFTLVELLAVIAVLGILMTVAVLGFNSFGRSVRLRSAARVIQQHLDGARELAMTRQGLYSVGFVPKLEPERDFLVLQWREKATSAPVQVREPYELPQGIEFGAYGSTFPGLEIQFSPTGRAVEVGGGPLTFKINDTDSGKEKEITVVPVTGHSQVTDE